MSRVNISSESESRIGVETIIELQPVFVGDQSLF